MGLSNTIDNVAAERAPGHDGYTLLNEENGCVAGCRAGISDYNETDFLEPGLHTDQEGFYVISGRGEAMVGNERINLKPGICFIVPAGVPHSIRAGQEGEVVRVFWFHAAIG